MANFFLILRMFLISMVLSLSFVFVSMILFFSVFSFNYLSRVSKAADFSIPELVSTFRNGWEREKKFEDSRVNILLLGIDELANRDSDAVLTDTMMVLSLDFMTGKTLSFSLPRDVYLQQERLKLNGVYNVARLKGDAKPELATKQIIEKLTGLSFDYVVVMDITTVGKLIDSIGGLDVTIDNSFVDNMFPREDVDVRKEKDESKLYVTVGFEKGIEHMDGKRSLQFIRSRHSVDLREGSDDARVKRQQKVISALIHKLSDPSLIKHPSIIGSLIRLYLKDIDKFIPLGDAIAIGRQLLVNKSIPFLDSKSIPIQGTDLNPIFYHPTSRLYKQWVYLPLDPSWVKLQLLITKWIKE